MVVDILRKYLKFQLTLRDTSFTNERNDIIEDINESVYGSVKNIEASKKLFGTEGLIL